jgi:hypothetical protein
VGKTEHTKIPSHPAVFTLMKRVIVGGLNYPEPTSAEPLSHGGAALTLADLPQSHVWGVITCSPVATVVQYRGRESGLHPDGRIETGIPGSAVDISGTGDRMQSVVFSEKPGEPPPEVRLTGTGSGQVTLVITRPDGETISFPPFDVQAGDEASTIPRGTASFALVLDRGGDGTVDQTLAPAGTARWLYDPPSEMPRPTVPDFTPPSGPRAPAPGS